MSKPAELSLGGSTSLREAGLWAAAAAVILLVHGAFGYAMHSMEPFNPPMDAEQQALTIDLAPIPIAAAEAVPSEEAAPVEPVETVSPLEEPPAVETSEAVTPDTVKPDETFVAQEDVSPDEPVRTQDEVPSGETVGAELEKIPPDIIDPVEDAVEAVQETVEPEVVLPESAPKPEAKKAEPVKRPFKKPERQQPRKLVKAVERGMTKPKPGPQTSQKAKASTAPKVNPNVWNKAVRAAIVRRAASVSGMQGTVRVQFMVNPSGTILSANLASSSGNAKLDGAALRMVRSARVPPQPPGLSGSTQSFSITLKFQ